MSRHDTMNRHYTSKEMMKRLLVEYIAPHKMKMALAIVCMVLAALMTATNAWMMQPMLDKVFLQKDATMLTIIPIAVFLVTFINSIANYGNSILMRFVGQRIIADMQIKLFEHVIHSDLSLFHDQTSGRLISRFTGDIQLMRMAVSSVFTGLAKELLTAICLIGVMFYQSWQMAVIALVVFPIAGWPVIRLGKNMRKISHKTQMQLGDFSATLDEVFQGARVVKAYAREDFEVNRAKKIIDHLFKLYIKAARVQSASGPMMEAFAGLAIAGVIAYGGSQVVNGETTPGAFFSFIAAMIMAYRPAKIAAGLNTTLQEGLASANRYFQVIDTPPVIQNNADAKPLIISNAAVAFENVTFAYEGTSVGLTDFSMDAPGGKTIALVGASGAGKSTVINLLLRFYEATSGSITIDGQDIRNVTLSSLRNNMAFVSQDTVLFDDTVRANIAYGKLDATDEEIFHAAQLAAADEFIRALPQGYDTIIGPHGVKLSGGQKQRLAIARALLKDAPILLLDEATSSLDNVSERLVQEALARLMKNRTTIVIAHRLSTVINADRLYVLDHGRIVESGTHEALLAKKGAYSTLYSRQFKAEAVTADS